MKWNKKEILINNNLTVSAQTPIIISASRATDIPAFYSEWFFERFTKGYIKWKNPFNSVNTYISFQNTRLIVFWSKNPKPIFKYLNKLDDLGINYYFQFTLNDFDKEKIERNVPELKKRIDIFIELSEKIGKEKVIWRFDPLFLSNEIGTDILLNRIENIGDQLKNYTKKFVFSFADISVYKKVTNTLNKESVNYVEFTQQNMLDIAKGISELNKKWNFEVGTCTEEIDLERFGILHNKCIDDDLIIRLFYDDEKLMNFLGVKVEKENSLFGEQNIIKSIKFLKDKGQRDSCGCIMSKDIGQYNTCPFGCVYCYANSSLELPIKNYKKAKSNIDSDTITGD